MNQLRAILLVLVYAVTLTTVPVAARNYAFITSSSETAEKESVTTSTFEHRESSSIKITGKLVNVRRHVSNKPCLSFSDTYAGITKSSQSHTSVPAYVLHCVYRL